MRYNIDVGAFELKIVLNYLKNLRFAVTVASLAFAGTACIQPSGSGTTVGGGSSQSSAPATIVPPLQGLLSDAPQFKPVAES